MKTTIIELENCENLNYIKGLAENTMIVLNSIGTLELKIIRSDNSEFIIEKDTILSISMNLTNGFASVRINITKLNVLVIVTVDVDDKLTDKFISYFLEQYLSEYEKHTIVKMGKKSGEPIVHENTIEKKKESDPPKVKKSTSKSK